MTTHRRRPTSERSSGDHQPSHAPADQARARSATSQRTTTRSGRHGEELACRALQRQGYRIEARNLRLPSGEIDLLVRRGRCWIAVEVKARRDHPAPERCITPTQLDRIERSLRLLEPTLRPRPRALRIDVVTVRWPALKDGSHALPQLDHFPSFRQLAVLTDDIGLLSRFLAHCLRGRDRQRSRDSTDNSPHHSAISGAAQAPGHTGPHFSLPLDMVTLAEQMIPRRKLLLLFCETLLFVAVILVGTSVPPLSSKSFLLLEPSEDLLRGFVTSLTIAIICQASLSYNDLYDWKVSQNRANLANRLVHSYGYALVMLGFLALVAGGLFYLPGIGDINSETWKLIVLVGIAYVLVFVFRHAFHWFFYKWRFGERVIVLGSSPEAMQLSRMIQDNPMAGFELLGIIEEQGQPPLVTRATDPPLIGTLECLHTKCRDEGISRVIVALKERRGKFPVDALLRCRMDGVIIEEREAMYERLTGKLAVESMRPSYLIYGRGFTKDPLTMALKRVLDILASSIGIVLSLPICLLTALAIKLTSRGPILFRQERVGEDGESFHLIKFRTMRPDAEAKSGPVWAQKNDSRITKIGKFMRLTRIDEIPQFVNILGGQMSFVGPRPERPHFVNQLQQDIPFYPLRHTVKPGLTGWAQVSHPYGASIEDAQEKLRYDLYYIKNMSLLFDVNIILRTVSVILRGSGAR